MIRSKVPVLAFVVTMFLPRAVPAQHGLSDTLFVNDARLQAVALYNHALNRQQMLYNGTEYYPYPEPYDDFPYFASEYWEEGSVKYYGERYEEVAMQYDLFNDVLVIEHYDQNGYMAEVALHTDKVDYFELLGHRFIRVNPDSAQHGGLRPGFYDLLHDGPNRLLCKRKKTVHQKIESGTVAVNFLEKSSYFLIRDGEVFPLRNKGSLLKVLADRKRLLKQYIRREVTDFHDKEKLLVDLVTYYDGLQ